MFRKVNVILLFVGVLFANPEYRDNIVLFCLNSDVQPLQIEHNNDKIEVNHETLNRFLKEIDGSDCYVEVVPQEDANKSLEESIEKLKSHSDKLGKLAEYINNYRINSQGRF